MKTLVSRSSVSTLCQSAQCQSALPAPTSAPAPSTPQDEIKATRSSFPLMEKTLLHTEEDEGKVWARDVSATSESLPHFSSSSGEPSSFLRSFPQDSVAIPVTDRHERAEGRVLTGIDTLRLLYPLRLSRVPDFRVLHKSEVRAARWGEHALWRDDRGQTQWGAMAVRRVGAFRLRIAPVRPGGPPMLRAFFSAPRVRFGDNGRVTDQRGLQEVLECLQAVLSDLGVEIDWREGQVGRMDVCRDVLLPRPFHYYLPVLHLIEPRYGRLWQNYPTGVVRGTATKTAYSLYDKRAQRRAQGLEDREEAQERGWLRCECRLPTACAVREKWGSDSVLDLVERFKELGMWLDERVRSDLLPPEPHSYIAFPTSKRPTLTPAHEMWWQAKLQGPSRGLKDRLALLGLRFAFEHMEPQEFWEMARAAGGEEAGSLAKLRRDLRDTALEGYSDEALPMAQLYDEVRGALLGHPTMSPSGELSWCKDSLGSH